MALRIECPRCEHSREASHRSRRLHRPEGRHGPTGQGKSPRPRLHEEPPLRHPRKRWPAHAAQHVAGALHASTSWTSFLSCPTCNWPGCSSFSARRPALSTCSARCRPPNRRRMRRRVTKLFGTLQAFLSERGAEWLDARRLAFLPARGGGSWSLTCPAAQTVINPRFCKVWRQRPHARHGIEQFPCYVELKSSAHSPRKEKKPGREPCGAAAGPETEHVWQENTGPTGATDFAPSRLGNG